MNDPFIPQQIQAAVAPQLLQRLSGPGIDEPPCCGAPTGRGPCRWTSSRLACRHRQRGTVPRFSACSSTSRPAMTPAPFAAELPPPARLFLLRLAMGSDWQGPGILRDTDLLALVRELVQRDH